MSKSSERYGVLIDVGSGSVLVAIIRSAPAQKHPDIIWAHREHAPLRNIDSLEQSAKAVMTALVNASMMLDGEGRKVLFDYDKSAKLTELQCGIAAPWSYTVTKTINYKQEKKFVITEELVDELTRTIQNKIKEDLKEDEMAYNLGLTVITRANMEMLTSGYRIKHPEGGKSDSLTLSHTSVVAQKYVSDAIDEMRDKLFAGTKSKKLSFMLMLYAVTKELFPETYDLCLVDITYEASEIGIMRDGVLTYCTHTPFGYFSLAREISSITGAPLHEAFGYLHSEAPFSFTKTLNAQKRKEVENMFEAYVDRIATLFHETGDTLSIPRRLSLHVDLGSEPVFTELLGKAVKRTIKAEPNIIPMSKEIISRTYEETTKGSPQTIPNDTALLLSAMFFHTQEKTRSFEYF
ncbi:hypothetical protein KC865_03185 [Candidatus Kaiserbacteria bacterium]|nr:hypothetical protein [Candidatus Kaiserbacteria bacterium]